MAVGADSAAAVEDPPAAKRFVRNLMDTMVRVSVSDGRLITGQMWCFDNLKNLILLNCQETRMVADEAQHRPLGPLVMVPGKHITKIEAVRRRASETLARGSARLRER